MRLLKGIGKELVEVPLVELHLQTDFVNENILCGLIAELPEGVEFLLGNDLWSQTHPSTASDYNAVVTRRQAAAEKAAQVIPHPDPHSQTQSVQEPVTKLFEKHYGDIDLTAVTSAAEFKRLQQQDTGIVALQSLVEQPPFPTGQSYFYMLEDVLMRHAAATKRCPEAEQL